MSAVPPSCFDWIKGRGTAIHYGGATVLVEGNGTRTKFETSDITQSGAGVQVQFLRLDTRFLKNASGWGNIAGTNY